jgi:hypothetical protein
VLVVHHISGGVRAVPEGSVIHKFTIMSLDTNPYEVAALMLAAEEIKLEREKLGPIRDRISEANERFDHQLEEVDRISGPEVRTINETIQHHREESTKIQNKMKDLSAELAKSEQSLKGKLAEAGQLNSSIKDRKGVIQASRDITLAPLYDELSSAQIKLRSDRSTRAARLSSAVSTLSGLASNTVQEASVDGQASGGRASADHDLKATALPSTEISTNLNDHAAGGSEQGSATDHNRVLLQGEEPTATHETISEAVKRNPRGFLEQEVDYRSVYSSRRTRELSTSSLSLTSLGSTPTNPYSDLRSRRTSSSGVESAISRFDPPSSCFGFPALDFTPPSSGFAPSISGQDCRSDVRIEFTVANGLFTSPKCMEGVPVGKLVEGDNYWEDSWKKLGDWYPGVGRDSGREESIAFFIMCPIHPNQLLAKKYYDSIGLCTRKYPIILRRILQVLKCAKVGDPVHWLRHRLAQLIASHEKDGQSGNFGMKGVLHDFQKSDPIYQPFYQGHRYKSISAKKRSMSIHFTFRQ